MISLRWGLLGAGMMLAALPALAVNVQLSHFPPDPGVLPGGGFEFKSPTNFSAPPPQRAWVNGVYGSVPKVGALTSMTVVGPTGNATFTVAQRALLTDVAAAVGRCVLGANLLCAAGTTAAVIYASYRMNKCSNVPGCEIDPSLLDFDPGQATTSAPGYNWGYAAVNWPNQVFASDDGYASALNAANAFKAYAATQGCTLGSMAVLNTGAFKWNGGNGCSTYAGAWTNQVSKGSAATLQSCPASIDPFNSAYNVPAGRAVGPDGKCPTARYYHVPYTPSQAAAKIAAYPPTFTGTDTPASPTNTWPDALKDAIASGQDVPAEGTASGPAAQNGPTTTTTTVGPTGTTTEVTNPVYNYTYNDNRVTWNITSTTVQSSSAASAPTTTVTTSGPAADTKTCGYPGGPKCAIDETGTPTDKGAAYTSAEAAVTAKASEIATKITEAGNRTSLPWSFPFSLPVGTCVAIPLYTPPGMAELKWDPCNSGGVAIFRALLGWLLAGWCAWYIWDSTVRARSA